MPSRRRFIRMNRLSGTLSFSDAFNRSDGVLDNGWIANTSWAIVSGKPVNTPTLGATEFFTNPDMELSDGSWANSGSPSANERSNDQAHAGTYSHKVSVDAAGEGAQQYLSASAARGKWVKVSGWFYDVLADTIKMGEGNSIISARKAITPATWTQIIAEGVSPAASYYSGFWNLASSGTVYADDMSAKTLTVADLFAVKDFGQASNFYLEMPITLYGSTPAGFVACLDNPANPQNYLACYITYGYNAWCYVYIDKWVAGVCTHLLVGYLFAGTEIITYSAGATLRFEKEGSVVRAIYNGLQITPDISITDATIINNTKHGMLSTDPNNVLGTFTIGTITPYTLNGSPTSVFSFTSKNDTLITHAAPNDWLGRPTLCKSGSTWLMAYREGTEHGTGGQYMHLRFSIDEGANWGADDLFTDSGSVGGWPLTGHAGMTDMGEGMLFTAPNGDLLYHAYERPSSGTYQYRSINGGEDWTDEGKINPDNGIYGAQDYCVVGNTIFVTAIRDPNTDFAHPFQLVIFKSTDNAATWTQIVVDNVNDCNEAGICNPAGNTLLLVERDPNNSATVTYYYTSSDLGVTWSARKTMPVKMGGIQKPRLRLLLGGVVLIGREYHSSSTSYPVVWFSNDGGNTWSRRFIPSNDVSYVDTAYCDVMQRTTGGLYMASYKGASQAGPCNVQEMIFTVTP